ncbi:MAG: MBL fold metallo-hydrolase [Patescibacteria group bacterium]|nr:MBL fold metallo-hydrolase [Patescibacteria group bacterium]
MKNFRRYLPYILFIFLIIFLSLIWYVVYLKDTHSNILKVAYLDVGQGDAIYIEAPNGRQMLIDGGPGASVLSSLGQVMPFADRSIDLVLATHTDADHIGGFPFVLDKYKVGHIIENGASSDTRTFRDLESRVNKYKIDKIIATRGTRIILDKNLNIYFDILFPDRDISNFESNDGSIVGRLVYGNESFMFTGDATKYTEHLIMTNENSSTLHSQVLKLGHHGSRYSSSELWLLSVHPDVAIISAGLNNRYGHPHQEVLDLLKKLSIPYLTTYQKGTIIFKTDGVTLTHN